MNTNSESAPMAQDRSLAEAHVYALTGDSNAPIDLRLLPDPDGMTADAINERGTIADLWPLILDKQAQGYGAFITVNETNGRGRSKADIVAPRAAWADLDGPDAMQQLAAALAFDPPPSFIVRTSPAKAHVYWTLPAGRNVDQAAAINRKLRIRFNGDGNAVDTARVLRLSGTLHLKGKPHLVRCEQGPGFGPPVPLERLEGALAGVVDHGDSRTGGRRYQPGEGEQAAEYGHALEALNARSPDMDRTDEKGGWLLFGGSFVAATHGRASREQRLADFQAWNTAYGATNDPAANARTFADFERNGTDGDWRTLAELSGDMTAIGRYWFETPRKPLADPGPMPVAAKDTRRIINASNLFVRVGDVKPEPVLFHVDGLIPEDALVVIYGAPKQGKTFVGMDLCACIATGETFHGQSAKQGTVFYIAGEGFKSIEQRFAAWAESRGVDLGGTPLFRSQQAVQMLDQASADMVVQAVDMMAAQHGAPRLIAIDTLARNFGPGDENSTPDMSRFIAALDTLRVRYPGCTILVIHHSGVIEKNRARGSGALLGAADAEFRVEMSKDGDGPVLYNTAMKEAAPRPAMQFRFVDAAGSVALEYVGGATGASGGLTPTAKAVMEAFRSIAADGSTSDGDWREAFYRSRPADEKQGTKRTAFNRGRKELINAHLINEDGANYKLAPMPGIVDR